MNPETIELNANRIANVLNMRRRTSPVPIWLLRKTSQAMQELRRVSVSEMKERLGSLYAGIEPREKRDFWFCMALVENLSYLPQNSDLVEIVGHRALYCFYECTSRKQHSFLSQLKRKFRESQCSSFSAERHVACRILEGEPVDNNELDLLTNPDSPGDLRLAIARRIARLGQKEHFRDVVKYFMDMSRRRERKEIDATEYVHAERLMGEMREYYFVDWLPHVYEAYSESFNEGAVRGRMLNVLAHSGDPLVEHLIELHHECPHAARRPIWRLLHQMVRNGSTLAFRAMADLVLQAAPQDRKALCEETRQAISDYITKTPAEKISVEILEMTKTLHESLNSTSHADLCDLADELHKLLDWDVRHLLDMIDHLLQDSATPEEKNRLCRGGHITLNALFEVARDPLIPLDQRQKATWFMPLIAACGSHPTLGPDLWALFVEGPDTELRIAILSTLVKTRWRALSQDRQVFEDIYRQSDDRLKVAITRQWNALFPGSQPALKRSSTPGEESDSRP